MQSYYKDTEARLTCIDLFKEIPRRPHSFCTSFDHAIPVENTAIDVLQNKLDFLSWYI